MLVALLAFIAGILTASPKGMEGAPPVEEIVRRHVEARGGREKLEAIGTLVYSQGLYTEGDFKGNGRAFMAFSRPCYRVVGNPENPGHFMEGSDGAPWEWYADPGVVLRTVGPAAGATRRGADFEGPLVDYREKGSTVTPCEPKDFEGRATFCLTVTTRDGFARDLFLDRESYLVVGERRTAPVHAFGNPVTSITSIEDYRPVAGVPFAHRYVEVNATTGAPLSSMQWGKIEANRPLPHSWFSPPDFTRSELQRWIENLYAGRDDEKAVMWTYAEFRRAFPEVDTRAGVEFIGYQMLKMGSVPSAVALLEANARDHPDAASSAWELGRAYRSAGRMGEARAAWRRAVELQPDHRKAREALEGSL